MNRLTAPVDPPATDVGGEHRIEPAPAEPHRLVADVAEQALGELLCQLSARAYRFVTPTPATHARVLARTEDFGGRSLRDVLGWSMPFEPEAVPSDIHDALLRADAVETLRDGRLRCRYRVSSLGEDLFLHSAFPTQDREAVFFGPDSYRFAQLVRTELARQPPPAIAHLVDVGAGAGVGGMVALRACPGVRVTLTDINPAALRLARINMCFAGLTADYALGEDLQPVGDAPDIVLANPPYIIDAAGRDYRDGGDMHGAAVSYEIALAAVTRLAPGGRLILYTGSPIIGGRDELRDALATLARRRGCDFRYWEIDPDVFGEELERPEYRQVERIAAVACVITRSS